MPRVTVEQSMHPCTCIPIYRVIIGHNLPGRITYIPGQKGRDIRGHHRSDVEFRLGDTGVR